MCDHTRVTIYVNSLGLVLCTRALSRTFMPVPCSMFYPSRSHTLDVFHILPLSISLYILYSGTRLHFRFISYSLVFHFACLF
ncbi:hypothetical protein M6B38_175855 [Iris pallida]|uniref:Uncharacterized protein n=1 Tax=Iris pallida TaxID=29817 RepID=A0AAX6EQT3_IRIPA|nr:hypothetical protein M6B38_175855 [Iris pallida]